MSNKKIGMLSKIFFVTMIIFSVLTSCDSNNKKSSEVVTKDFMLSHLYLLFYDTPEPADKFKKKYNLAFEHLKKILKDKNIKIVDIKLHGDMVRISINRSDIKNLVEHCKAGAQYIVVDEVILIKESNFKNYSWVQNMIENTSKIDLNKE
jgi:hypothetical protein